MISKRNISSFSRRCALEASRGEREAGEDQMREDGILEESFFFVNVCHRGSTWHATSASNALRGEFGTLNGTLNKV